MSDITHGSKQAGEWINEFWVMKLKHKVKDKLHNFNASES